MDKKKSLEELLKTHVPNVKITKKDVVLSEGQGRKAGAGGAACDFCPHCYGNANWCPLMDND